MQGQKGRETQVSPCRSSMRPWLNLLWANHLSPNGGTFYSEDIAHPVCKLQLPVIFLFEVVGLVLSDERKGIFC